LKSLPSPLRSPRSRANRAMSRSLFGGGVALIYEPNYLEGLALSWGHDQTSNMDHKKKSTACHRFGKHAGFPTKVIQWRQFSFD